MKQLPARVSRFRLLWEWLLSLIQRIDHKLMDRSFDRHKSEFYGAVKRQAAKQAATWSTVLSARTITNAIKRKRGELS